MTDIFFFIRGARVVGCLILFAGFTDAIWPLNLNISDDFKVHSKEAFNNYLLKMRGEGSKMLCSGYKNCPGGQKMAKVFLHSPWRPLNHLLPIYLICWPMNITFHMIAASFLLFQYCVQFENVIPLINLIWHIMVWSLIFIDFFEQA